MSIINNSHAIGVDTRNLVLKTRGSLHVKVGDRYYEIDFRNLKSEETEEKEEKEKEQYIITVDNESAIADMEFPGDGKLIIGTLDGTMYATVKGEYINVTPKQTTSNLEDNSDLNKTESSFEIDSAFVAGKLVGADDTELDFANNSFITNDVVVKNSFSFPKNTVLMNCCKSDALITDYKNYDFIELTSALTNMRVKSGVMIKSNITATINVSSEEFGLNITFEAGYTYIVYIQRGLLTYTRL